MSGIIRILAIYALIFIVVNYAFKILRRFTGTSNKPGKTVDENRNVQINIEKQPRVGSNKGDYIDYEDVTDAE